MIWTECKEWIKKEKAFLDTIDLAPFLEQWEDVHDIMDAIEDMYNDKYTDEEYLFNCMDCHDFMDYVKQRYPNIGFTEHIEYRVTGYV